jgi:hypothetical protein
MLDTAEERSGSFVFELPRHPVEKISAEGEDAAGAID